MTATHIGHFVPTNRDTGTPPPAGEHPSGLPITHLSAAADWEAVSGRAQANLRRRGVDIDTAQDVLQEVALKLLANPQPFNDEEHRDRWIVTVAWRLVQNRWRADRRLAYQDPPDVGGGEDPADVVVSRESLLRVLDGYRRLGARDREAICLGLEPGRQDGAIVVRRHRARAQLARLRCGIGLGAMRCRSRLAQLFERVGPAVVGGVVALGPTVLQGDQSVQAQAIAVAPSPDWSTRVTTTPEPATPLPLAGVGGPQQRQPTAGPSTAPDARVHATKVGAHGVSVGIEFRPPPREGGSDEPTPLICILGMCHPHPARGILTP